MQKCCRSREEMGKTKQKVEQKEIVKERKGRGERAYVLIPFPRAQKKES